MGVYSELVPSFSDRQVVRMIPGLKMLNGEPVKTTVQFAVEQMSNAPEVSRTRIPLPASIQGHFGREEIRKPLLTFLMEYFGRYDTQQRGESIYSYYISESTLTMALNPDPQFSGKRVLATLEAVNSAGERQKVQLMTNSLSDVYFKNNRNLIRCKGESRRMDLVSQGPINIASVLGKLPLTEHILESFCIDVMDQSDNQIILSVTGVFYEISPQSGSDVTLRKTLRCFNRLMILVAPGTKILQENIIISNPTEPLIQRYIRDVRRASKVEVPRPGSSASQSGQSQVNSGTIIAPGIDQETIISEFKRQTGMNVAFSRQCLEEFGWRFEEALNGFRSMHAAGRIPQDAFIPD